jgi:hypothetical protein
MECSYARLSVVQRDFHWTTGRADHERHDHSVQQLRRSLLAQYRNQLFYLTYNVCVGIGVPR